MERASDRREKALWVGGILAGAALMLLITIAAAISQAPAIGSAAEDLRPATFLLGMIFVVFLPPVVAFRIALVRMARRFGPEFPRQVSGGLGLLSIAVVTVWAIDESRRTSPGSAMAWVGLFGCYLFVLATTNFLKPPVVDAVTSAAREAPRAPARGRRLASPRARARDR
jgi:O-antigen/teichoic acid export membrane protein